MDQTSYVSYVTFFHQVFIILFSSKQDMWSAPSSLGNLIDRCRLEFLVVME
jgi:hypothetical protein